MRNTQELRNTGITGTREIGKSRTQNHRTTITAGTHRKHMKHRKTGTQDNKGNT